MRESFCMGVHRSADPLTYLFARAPVRETAPALRWFPLAGGAFRFTVLPRAPRTTS